MASASGLLPWEFARLIAAWAVCDGLVELAAGGQGRGQRIERQRVLLLRHLTTHAGPRVHRRFRIEEMWGSGLVAKAQARSSRPAPLPCVCRRLRTACRIAPPRRAAAARQHGQQGPKTLLALAILAPLEPLAGQQLQRSDVLGIQFQRLLQEPDGLVGILAGEGDSRQAQNRPG